MCGKMVLPFGVAPWLPFGCDGGHNGRMITPLTEPVLIHAHGVIYFDEVKKAWVFEVPVMGVKVSGEEPNHVRRVGESMAQAEAIRVFAGALERIGKEIEENGKRLQDKEGESVVGARKSSRGKSPQKGFDS